MNREREYNLDLLRIVAMLMIITLHFLGKGGVLGSPILEERYNIAWILESISIVSVNAYVLISGYFLITSKFKVAKLLQLLAQVLFFSVFVSLLLVVTHNIDLNPSTIVTTLLPTLTGQYWFVSAYVGMYVLSPFLNILIDHLKKRQHLALALALVSLFSVWPSVFWSADIAYHIYSGYSVMWFAVLYIIAAYLRKYYRPDYKLSKHMIRYGAMAMGTALFVLALAYGHAKTGIGEFQSLKGSLFSYNSITTLVTSLLLFVAFINMRISNRNLNKVIALLAPLTFGVYLLHEHPLLRGWLWTAIFDRSTFDETHFTIFAILVILSIYLVGSIVDYARARIFIFIGNTRIFKTGYARIERSAVVYRKRLLERFVS